MPFDPKLTRCIRLLSAFHARGELATRDVMRLLDCDRQTAMRDVRSLQDAAVPIEARGDGQARRYVLPEAYRKQGLVLTVGDTLALLFGRQLIGFLEGTTLSNWLDELMDKLAPAASQRAVASEAGLMGRLVYLSEPYRRYDAHDDTLNEILTALLDNREMSLSYTASEPRTYAPVQPLALVIYRRALYLLARIPGYDKTLRLALERITAAKRLQSSFTLPKGYDARVELAGVFGIADTGEPPSLVRLRFAPQVARLVRSRVWHPTQQLAERPDGGVELCLTASGRELVRLVLEFGDKVEVIEPAWLREAVVAELEGALAQYKVSPASARAAGS